MPVRDREAPGSNPGPPTKIEFKIGDFARSVEPPDQRPDHRSARSSPAMAELVVALVSQSELAGHQSASAVDA